MEISDGEKLIMIMLSDIMEGQNSKNSVDPNFIRSAIYYDCLWGLPWEYPGIPFSETATPPQVEWVMNILQMWTMLEKSYAMLTSEEKSEVERKTSPFGADPLFSGFEENSEREQCNITKFLIYNLKRFLNFKGRDINSPIPLGGRYQRMYEIYEKIFPDIQQGKLTMDQIISILCQEPEN